MVHRDDEVNLSDIHNILIDVVENQGGIKVRLEDLDSKLTNHITEEHKSFEAALQKVEKISLDVDRIYTSANVIKIAAGALLVVLGAITGTWSWFADNFKAK